jgi:hypothetical protein
VAGDEYLLDTPTVRAFVADAAQAIAGAPSPQAACDAIRPRFAALLADPDWLPARFQAAAPGSGMGGGIGQWLLFRAGDRSLSLFALLVPPGAETSVSIHQLTNDTGCVWRHAYDAASGERRPFRSGYVNVPCEED